jgi:hypothetical protein
MKPLHIIFLAFCLLFTTISRAQEKTFFRSVELRFAPLSLIDLRTPTFQAGLQYNATKRLGFSLDFGYGINPQKNTGIVNRHYYKVRSEIRLFLSSKGPVADKSVAYYTSLEGFYIPERFRQENGWYTEGSNYYRYEYNDIQKTVLGACVKFGGEYIGHSGFLIDFYLGLGYRNVQYHNSRHNETLSPDPIWQEWFKSSDYNDGRYPRPHLAAGFKVGYMIWKE